MPPKRLSRSFFTRDTRMVAKELLGKLIVRTYRDKKIAARILETEAYVGEDDLASHARFGKTKRNTIMYGKAGHAYVYFIYGMHDMLNIVTDKKDFPAAVLIRGALFVNGAPSGPEAALRGPGRLTRALKITRALNGEDMVNSRRLYVADDGYQAGKGQIQRTPRIGVEYAGKHAALLWRYVLQL